MTSDQTPPAVGAAQPAGGQVSVQPDGTLVFTHGHRYPDNVQRVTQTHRPDGSLQSVHVTLSGFAGPVLDMTATFDAAGKFVREEGYRAAGVKDTVSSFVLPLPARSVTAAPVPTPPAPTTAAPLEELSELSGFGGTAFGKVASGDAAPDKAAHAAVAPAPQSAVSPPVVPPSTPAPSHLSKPSGLSKPTEDDWTDDE